VADCCVALKRGKGLFVEYLGDKAGCGTHIDGGAIGNCNAGALLSAVLKGEQGEEHQSRCVLSGGVDAEDAAALVHEGPVAWIIVAAVRVVNVEGLCYNSALCCSLRRRKN